MLVCCCHRCVSLSCAAIAFLKSSGGWSCGRWWRSWPSTRPATTSPTQASWSMWSATGPKTWMPRPSETPPTSGVGGHGVGVQTEKEEGGVFAETAGGVFDWCSVTQHMSFRHVVQCHPCPPHPASFIFYFYFFLPLTFVVGECQWPVQFRWVECKSLRLLSVLPSCCHGDDAYVHVKSKNCTFSQGDRQS